MLLVLLIVVCLVLVLGGLPGYGPLYSHWGSAPIGLGGVFVIILIILLLTGHL
jgi:hypothetical protein